MIFTRKLIQKQVYKKLRLKPTDFVINLRKMEVSDEEIYVVTRSGRHELVSFDKIRDRIRGMVNKEPRLTHVNHISVSQKTIAGLHQGITTAKLDILAAECAAYMSTVHPEYETLAARICISNLHKQLNPNLRRSVELLRNYKDFRGNSAPCINEECYQIICENIDVLQAAIDYERDYKFDYFGYKVLEKSYLQSVDNKIIETPQDMIMRVAVGNFKSDIANVIKAYNYISQHYFTVATPNLLNAGTPFPQMSSCFLMTMKEDSIDGIYSTLKNQALISKYAGGIGCCITNIRAKNSYIRGTRGRSDGIMPMLRVENDTARYVNQGGGKRKGSFAMYIEPWHADIIEFLMARRNSGKEENRARDLFYGLWIPDLFMKRVDQNAKWSLMCPDECPGLIDVWGDEFDALYTKYESEGLAHETIDARDLWLIILDSQIETGTPYMLYKDACNRKSNQKNLGTTHCSNLCTEVIQYSSADEIAVCNLASVSLVKCIMNGAFDHNLLYEIVYFMCETLNRVIDENHYVLPECKVSNMRHRPIGIGVQGLANTFAKLRYPFDSSRAKQLNSEIFETIYYAALRASCDLAKKLGPYETFAGSPYSKGIFAYDYNNVTPTSRWPFNELKQDIIKHGTRNSLLVAPMPTASTSQILGNNECFEPFTTNIYVRRVLAGEFTIINKYLVNDLIDIGIWNEKTKGDIIANNGSVQNLSYIPQDIRDLYKTVWEISMRDIIDMAHDREAFIDQGQSLNLFLENPTRGQLTSMHFYSWKLGMKNGMYYLRTRPAADPIKFTLDPKIHKRKRSEPEPQICKMEEGCVSCSG